MLCFHCYHVLSYSIHWKRRGRVTKQSWSSQMTKRCSLFECSILLEKGNYFDPCSSIKFYVSSYIRNINYLLNSSCAWWNLIRWSLIAGRIPGRTAEEIEKYWNSRYSTSKWIDCVVDLDTSIECSIKYRISSVNTAKFCVYYDDV